MGMNDHGWTENGMARALADNLLASRSVLVVPRCGWVGHECDLLCVDRKSLRIVEVEIKISRADLRADAKKFKWEYGAWSRSTTRPKRLLGPVWPYKVWKHYYAMPAEIWHPDLAAGINAASGILLIHRVGGKSAVRLERQAMPNKAALPIGAHDCIDIARLASLRMWAALTR